ncbi:MAG TPA: glycosyl hydrolase [Solirubrobacterales bacterium]
MELLLNSGRLILFALLAAAVSLFLISSGSAEARGKTNLRAAVSLGQGAPGAGKCMKLANSRARAATNQAAARRVRARVMRRCMVRQRRSRVKPAVPPTLVGGDLVVGIDGGYTGWSDDEIEERTELGAAVTRHEWDPTEPVDEQDDVMELAFGEIHTKIHALLGGNDLGDPTHYREWVVDFIDYYGVGGSFWDKHPELDESRFAITSVELGNEPYFGEMSPEEYAATVGPVLEEIKRLNLPVTVVLPSRVYGSNTSWMDTLYELIPNLNDLFDAFAEHPYWYGHEPSTPGAAGPFGRIETTRLRMNEHGANTKPIWITEYGESTADCGEECVGEDTQAKHLQQMLDAVVSRSDWGVKMISVFQLRDRGTDSGDRERQFGLLRQDGSEKPAYPIVESAMDQFRG